MSIRSFVRTTARFAKTPLSARNLLHSRLTVGVLSSEPRSPPFTITTARQGSGDKAACQPVRADPHMPQPDLQYNGCYWAFRCCIRDLIIGHWTLPPIRCPFVPPRLSTKVSTPCHHSSSCNARAKSTLVRERLPSGLLCYNKYPSCKTCQLTNLLLTPTTWCFSYCAQP